MRLFSYLEDGGDRLGVLLDGGWLPASDLVTGALTIDWLLQRGRSGLAELSRAAAARVLGGPPQSVGGLELAAPVPRPGKIVAVGRNYLDHAAEEGAALPTAPLLFAKWPSAVVGHRAEITWDPELTSQVDYEGELAVVIGTRARRVTPSEALGHVLGYTCLNDVSARDLQVGDGQWVRGKSLDTFCPMGPMLVTADEIPDPQALRLTCRVNGETVQEGTTADMLFSIAEIISFCSASFTLSPGDVIATGTPAGVGVFRDPPRFLRDGDEVAVEVAQIGTLINTCTYDRAG